MIPFSSAENKCFIGADVSKSWIDFADTQGRKKRVANDDAVIAALFTGPWAREQCGRIVCEATGGYERSLLRVAARLALPLCRVHPNRTHAFSKVFGASAKTDALDAKMLARYAAATRQDPLPPLPSQARQTLADLISRLDQIKALRHAELCRLEQTVDRFLRASIEQVVAVLDAQKKAVSKAVEAAIAEDEDLARRYKILRSCKGVGPQLAQAVLAWLPEAGALNRRQIAALVGVAPITRESGSSIKGAHIRGGRKPLRDILYMAAVAGITHNPVLKTFYERLKREGKPSKVALVAVMRKMILTLNAMLKTGTMWSKEFPMHA